MQKLAPALSNPSLPWNEGPTSYFEVVNFLPVILSAIYRQMQFKDDFGFDEEDDDEVAIMEVGEEFPHSLIDSLIAWSILLSITMLDLT